MASSLVLPMSDDAKNAWQGVRVRRHKFAIWKIENSMVELERVGKNTETEKNFVDVLTDTQCRYTVFDHEYKTKDGRIKSTLLFISWTPLNSNQNDKILYSQQRHAFKESLSGTVHYNVNTKSEIYKIFGKISGTEEEDEEDDD